MYIHFDAGLGVESHVLGRRNLKMERWWIKPGFVGMLLQRTNSSCSSGREKWNIASGMKRRLMRQHIKVISRCWSTASRNGCPCDEKEACRQAADEGHLDCLRFLFDKVKPSRETEEDAAIQAACGGHLGILKYLLVEERKISAGVKRACVYNAAWYGRLDCLKYFVEEAKVPLNDWQDIASARYREHPECVNYLLEKGCPEPTDEEYAKFVEVRQPAHEEENSDWENRDIFDEREREREKERHTLLF